MYLHYLRFGTLSNHNSCFITIVAHHNCNTIQFVHIIHILVIEIHLYLWKWLIQSVKKTQYNNLCNYDPKNKIVWLWNSCTLIIHWVTVEQEFIKYGTKVVSQLCPNVVKNWNLFFLQLPYLQHLQHLSFHHQFLKQLSFLQFFCHFE